MSKLRAAVTGELDRTLADGSRMTLVKIACSELAKRLEPTLGYEPSPTHVSRVMGELGWAKSIESGRVMFTRPTAEVA
jgi:hypothetical protein